MMTPMRKTRFAIVAFLALVMGAVWFFLIRSAEPTYEGKPVSYWFKEYYRPDDEDEIEPDHAELAETALEKMGSNALPYLIGMAFSSDKDTAFRTNFYQLLEQFPAGFHAPKFISWDEVRDRATIAIAATKSPASEVVPLMRRELEDTNSPNHHQSIRILSELDGSADIRVPYLSRALHEEDSQTSALAALNGLGADAKAALPDLMTLMQSVSSTNFLRVSASGVLSQFGTNAAPAIPLLTQFFNQETNLWRRFAFAEYLCRIDANQTNMLAFLINALTNDDDSHQAEIAATRLRFAGPNAKPAIPALLATLSTTNISLWERSATALQTIGLPEEQLEPRLREKLKTDDDAFKTAAAKQILVNMPADEEAQSVLIEQIKKHSEEEEDAMLALSRTGPSARAAVPGILEALKGTNVDVWLEVPQALHRLGAPPELFLPTLDAKLQSGDEWSGEHAGHRFRFAVHILDVESSDQAVQGFFLNIITNNLSEATAAIGCLSTVKAPTKEIISALKQASKSEDVRTRRMAEAALKKLNSRLATNSAAGARGSN